MNVKKIDAAIESTLSTVCEILVQKKDHEEYSLFCVVRNDLIFRELVQN
jgi:hypothetical protein